jgi:hypothetical protein
VDDYFKDLPKSDVNHWDHATVAERAKRIAKITAASIAPAPKGTRKRATKKKPKTKAKRRRGK